MDVAFPYAAITPSLEGEVLVTLSRSRGEMTGREVARLVKWGSQAGVNRALQRLTEHGIVTQRAAGRALLFSLNREHLAAPIVDALRDLRGQFIDRMRTSIAKWKVPPLHASLFGSLARRDGDTRSDIDFFIVRPKRVDEEDSAWRKQLDDLTARVFAWTGNRLGVSELSEAELGQLRRKRPAIAGDLERDAIDLAGPPIQRLLGDR